jgi:hypothetical protein
MAARDGSNNQEECSTSSLEFGARLRWNRLAAHSGHFVLAFSQLAQQTSDVCAPSPSVLGTRQMNLYKSTRYWDCVEFQQIEVQPAELSLTSFKDYVYLKLVRLQSSCF